MRKITYTLAAFLLAPYIFFVSLANGATPSKVRDLAAYKTLRLGMSADDVGNVLGVKLGNCDKKSREDWDYEHACFETHSDLGLVEAFFIKSRELDKRGIKASWGATGLWLRFSDRRLFQIGVDFSSEPDGAFHSDNVTESDSIPMLMTPDEFINGLKQTYGAPTGYNVAVMKNPYVYQSSFRTLPLAKTPQGIVEKPGEYWRGAFWTDSISDVIFVGRRRQIVRDAKPNTRGICCQPQRGRYFLVIETSKTIHQLNELFAAQEAEDKKNAGLLKQAYKEAQQEKNAEEQKKAIQKKQTVSPF